MVATVHKNVNLKFNIKMNIVKCFVILFLFISTNANSVSRTKCSALCMCDIHDGMRRTSCNHRFIVDVNLIIPNNVQIYDVSYNSISKLDDFCFRVHNKKVNNQLILS